MIHVVIKQERRKAPRQLALPINADILKPTGAFVDGQPEFIVTQQPPQLHTIGDQIDDLSNIAYAAEWDGVSPWIKVLVGSIADIKMAYAGWPMVTKEEYEALNPPSNPV
jgi:hypothetical protein